MNAHDYRSSLREHIAAIENELPLRILGRLPRGAAAHVFENDALDLLAEAKPGLSYISLGQAEANLAERLGRPVGIVLISELSGHDAGDVTAQLERL